MSFLVACLVWLVPLLAVAQQPPSPVGVNVRDYGAFATGNECRPGLSGGARSPDIVYYDLRGYTAKYLVNTTVVVGSGKTISGRTDRRSPTLGILTTAAVDTFSLANATIG